MIQPHAPESGGTLYELGRLALTFGLILFGIWVVLKLMLRSGKRTVNSKRMVANRRERRAQTKINRKTHRSRGDRGKR